MPGTKLQNRPLHPILRRSARKADIAPAKDSKTVTFWDQLVLLQDGENCVESRSPHTIQTYSPNHREFMHVVNGTKNEKIQTLRGIEDCVARAKIVVDKDKLIPGAANSDNPEEQANPEMPSWNVHDCLARSVSEVVAPLNEQNRLELHFIRELERATDSNVMKQLADEQQLEHHAESDLAWGEADVRPLEASELPGLLDFTSEYSEWTSEGTTSWLSEAISGSAQRSSRSSTKSSCGTFDELGTTAEQQACVSNPVIPPGSFGIMPVRVAGSDDEPSLAATLATSWKGFLPLIGLQEDVCPWSIGAMMLAVLAGIVQAYDRV